MICGFKFKAIYNIGRRKISPYSRRESLDFKPNRFRTKADWSLIWHQSDQFHAEMKEHKLQLSARGN